MSCARCGAPDSDIHSFCWDGCQERYADFTLQRSDPPKMVPRALNNWPYDTPLRCWFCSEMRERCRLMGVVFYLTTPRLHCANGWANVCPDCVPLAERARQGGLDIGRPL